MSDAVIAVGLLSVRDLERLGSGFTRAFPVDEVPCFGELLVAIDDADRQMLASARSAVAGRSSQHRPRPGNSVI